MSCRKGGDTIFELSGCSGVGPGVASVVQELRCSCRGRGGSARGNLASAPRRHVSAPEMGIVAARGGKLPRCSRKECFKTTRRADAKVMWALHISLLFCGFIFVGWGSAHKTDSQPTSTVLIRSDQASLIASCCSQKSRGFCL